MSQDPVEDPADKMDHSDQMTGRKRQQPTEETGGEEGDTPVPPNKRGKQPECTTPEQPQDAVEDLAENREIVDQADKFPIFRLPKELIAKTFSNLSMRDRMNVRVCKTLNAIEADYKYYVEKLVICDHYYAYRHRTKDGTQYIVYDANSSSDFITFLDRLSKNVSVGTLHIYDHVPSRIKSDFYNTVKKFNVKKVAIIYYTSNVLPDKFLSDMARKCHYLHLGGSISVEELHETYKGMVDGSMKLRHLSGLLNSREYSFFLDLIGIRMDESNNFFSNKDIEVHSDDYGKYNIFDGDLLIEWRGLCILEMVRYETAESLEEAKNKVRNEEGANRVFVAPM